MGGYVTTCCKECPDGGNSHSQLCHTRFSTTDQNKPDLLDRMGLVNKRPTCSRVRYISRDQQFVYAGLELNRGGGFLAWSRVAVTHPCLLSASVRSLFITHTLADLAGTTIEEQGRLA